MKKQLTTKTKVIVVVAVLLAVLLTVSSIVGANTGQNAVQVMLSPFRSAYSAFVRQAERLYNYIFRYEALQAENEALRKRIVSMEDDVRNADSLQRENERLRNLLELVDEHEEYHLTQAYIVSWDNSNWKSTFTLAKGTNSGIGVGMVVITEFGEVVGKVTDAGSNWATVTTLLDSSLEITAMISSTGYSGSVQGSYATGEEGKLRMNYLPTDAVLRNNDQVVTTGSTFYPRDLIIGYITDADFDETGVAKYAILSPAADFDDLEQIFIITNYVSQ